MLCNCKLLWCLAALPCPSQSYPSFRVESGTTNASMKTNDFCSELLLVLYISELFHYIVCYRSGLASCILFLILHNFHHNDSIKSSLAFTKISNLLDPAGIKIMLPKLWLLQMKIFICQLLKKNWSDFLKE